MSKVTLVPWAVAPADESVARSGVDSEHRAWQAYLVSYATSSAVLKVRHIAALALASCGVAF